MQVQGFVQDQDGVEYAEDDDELVVRVPMPDGTVARGINVTLEQAQVLRVDVKNQGTVLAGVLFARVKDLLWTLEDGPTVELTLTKQIRRDCGRWGRVFQRIDAGRRTVAPAEPKSGTRPTAGKNMMAKTSAKRLLITTLVVLVILLVLGFWLFHR